MKRFICVMLILVCFSTIFAGCISSGPQTTVIQSSAQTNAPKITYIADFYDNHGTPWLSVEGSSFNIEPNKVKEYYYDSEGYWASKWVLSSVVSVDIDGRDIETCGNTVIFADSRLEKMVIDIPKEVDTSTNGEASITAPGDINFWDGWMLHFWWEAKRENNQYPGSKVVVIQSQEGDPIGMYAGSNVNWEISRDLPKTTEITIDGKKLFIHRANFAVIDTDLIGGK